MGGKKRVSGNAYRHGLSLTISSIAPYTKSVDDLAKKIAAGAADARLLQRARAVAEAELDLRRVRTTKVTLIQRVHAAQIVRSGTRAARSDRSRQHDARRRACPNS
jgi:hypothetical protein